MFHRENVCALYYKRMEPNQHISRRINEHNDCLLDMQTSYRNYYDCNIMTSVAYKEATAKCRLCVLKCNSTIPELLEARNRIQHISKQYGTSRFSTMIKIHFRDLIVSVHPDIERWFHPVSARTYDARNMSPKISRAGRCNVAVEPLNENDCVGNVANRVLRFHGATISAIDFARSRVITVYGFFDNIDARISAYVASRLRNRTRAHFGELSLGQLMSFDQNDVREWRTRHTTELQNLKQLTTADLVKVFNKGDSMIDVIYSFLMEDTFYTRCTIQALCFLLQNRDAHAYHTLMRTIPDSLLDRLKAITSNEDNCVSDTLYLDYETRIRMIHCSDEIKQLAHKRLNEIRVKPFDSSFKAKQYLDTLLSIPFGRMHTSHAVKLCHENSSMFSQIATNFDPSHKRYTHVDTIRDFPLEVRKYHEKLARLIRDHLAHSKRADLTKTAISLNSLCAECNLNHTISYAGVLKSAILHNICAFFDFLAVNAPEHIRRVFDACGAELPSVHNATYNIMTNIRANILTIEDIVQKSDQIMDDAIYGQDRAKKSLQRIFAQVLNGEPRGYCIGFEGAPGLGKTSLAREGLSKLFADENGVPRPFAFIAVGGASTASLFDGHSYTYVESTCGKIVELLIQHKCMNPIIFIDEIDKLSQTDQGKELTGVITHLIDFTQNMEFQDKYFSGVTFNLSNILFIVSYNDATAIDRVILDRIHRVAFDSLSNSEKHVIAKKYLMPKILHSMGMEGRIEMLDETYKLIINKYTREAGVRKLSEHLHEIIGDITASQIRAGGAVDVHVVTPDDIDRMFHDKPTNVVELPTDEPMVGVANALWADSCSSGGVMRIEAQKYPSDKPCDLRLTGAQGGVMQESMHVAKTVAWNMLDEKGDASDICAPFVGIHVHCPVTAQPKDGPSAGLAISLAIYSLLSNRALRSNVCITGEISLKGRVDRVGGIKQKFIGAIEAGSRCILYPKANQPDVDSFLVEHPDATNVEYIPVDHIKDAIVVLNK